MSASTMFHTAMACMLCTQAPEAAAPLPAWRLNFSDPSLPQGPFVGAVRAAYQAAAWVRHHADLFPVLNT